MTNHEKQAMARRIYDALVQPSCQMYETTRAACIAEEDYDTFRECQQMAFTMIMHPRRFRVMGWGRQVGAIGIFGAIVKDLDAVDEDDARRKIYNHFEHISNLTVREIIK